MAQHFVPTFSSPFITTTSSYNPSSHPTNQPLFLYVLSHSQSTGFKLWSTNWIYSIL